jgi:hypothetical protein
MIKSSLNLFKPVKENASSSFLIFALISFSSVNVIFDSSIYLLGIILLLTLLLLYQKANTVSLRVNTFLFIILFLSFRAISLVINGFSIGNNFYLFGPIFLFSFYSLIFSLKNFFDIEKVNLYLEIFFLSFIFYGCFDLAISNKLIFYQQELRPWPLGIHPQWWAEIAIVLFFINISNINRSLIKKLSLALLIFLFVLLVQSRGALIAIFILMTLFLLKKSFKLSIFFLLLVLCNYSFLLDHILLLHDSYRGIEAGISGRLPILFDSIRQVNFLSFFFGSGYKSNLDVHNGFIRLFLEEGFFVSFFLYLSLVRFLYLKNTPFSVKIFLLSSALFMFFSPRLIGFNLLSIYSTFLYFKNQND